MDRCRLKRERSGFWGICRVFPQPRRPASPDFFGRGHNLGYSLRISPRVEWRLRHIALMFETEYTLTGYGQPDEMYRPDNTLDVSNIRFQAALMYHL